MRGRGGRGWDGRALSATCCANFNADRVQAVMALCARKHIWHSEFSEYARLRADVTKRLRTSSHSERRPPCQLGLRGNRHGAANRGREAGGALKRAGGEDRGKPLIWQCLGVIILILPYW